MLLLTYQPAKKSLVASQTAQPLPEGTTVEKVVETSSSEVVGATVDFLRELRQATISRKYSVVGGVVLGANEDWDFK
jgi:hypothetical protein